VYFFVVVLLASSIFRLIAVTPEGDSEMSEEAIIDTLVAGCGGSSDKKKSGCCEVQ